MKNILIADPLPLLTEGIQRSLSSLTDARVSGVCHTYSNLSESLDRIMPDILLLDEYLEFSPRKKVDKNPIWKRCAAAKVIIFHTEINLLQIRQNIADGVCGYLLKCVSPDELVLAVETVIHGNVYIQESVRRVAMEHSLGLCASKSMKTSLTRRELQVIQLIVEEYSTQEIATKLYISFNTVESHRKNLILKLGVRNSAGIVREAMRLHLYPSPA